MKLNHKSFQTPSDLTNFVQENQIRPEYVQAILEDNTLFYWVNEPYVPVLDVLVTKTA
jgi:hypothetical protein